MNNWNTISLWVKNKFQNRKNVFHLQKSSLISWNQPGEDCFCHSSARIVACVSEYIFLKQTHKQTKTRTQTKAKETKEEKRISPENRLEKIICGRPGEDFSCHKHFQKQEYFFWPGEVFLNFSFLQKYLRRRKCQAEIP